MHGSGWNHPQAGSSTATATSDQACNREQSYKQDNHYEPQQCTTNATTAHSRPYEQQLYTEYVGAPYGAPPSSHPPVAYPYPHPTQVSHMHQTYQQQFSSSRQYSSSVYEATMMVVPPGVQLRGGGYHNHNHDFDPLSAGAGGPSMSAVNSKLNPQDLIARLKASGLLR